MAVAIQVVFDCADPDRLARFWASALGYQVQPPPPGFDSWDAALEAWGVPEDQRDRASAIVDPDGSGPRLFFQKVPEEKAGKNRVHVDLHTVSGDLEARAAELEALGAARLYAGDELGSRWITMTDPEGNEFCVH
jgi:hypothetical protein